MQTKRRFAVASLALAIAAMLPARPARAHGDVDEPTHSHTHGAEGPPDDLPYVPGEPAPKGYHYENGPRRGAMFGGAVIFAIGYVPALTLAVACLGTECRGAAPGKGWETALAIPVAGPIVYAAGRCAGDHDRSCYLGTAGWILDAALQAGGLALFLHGRRKREIWIRDEVPVAMVPSTFGGTGMGLTFAGAF